MGILLMLLVAGNGCRNEHREKRDRKGNARMNMTHRGKDFRPMKGMRPGMGPGRMDRRGQLMYPRQMYAMNRGMRPGPDNRMGRGMGPMPMDRMGRGPMGPAGMRQEPIPNLTEKQKKDMAELRQKQQDDMKKIREEMSAKMKSLQETHRKKMQGLLTDEQKKFVESRSGNTNQGSAKVK